MKPYLIPSETYDIAVKQGVIDPNDPKFKRIEHVDLPLTKD